MSLDYATTSFPKNMSYHFDRIVNYSKQSVKINCDRTGTVSAGDTIRFTLPNNCLVDLDSLLWSYNLTANTYGTADGGQHRCRYMPRNSASIIDTLNIYANDKLVSSCSYYNHLYNSLTDHSCGTDFHSSGFRYLENTDPSVKPVYTPANGTLALVDTKALQTANTTDVDRQFIVRNWLSFLGTAGTKVIDTSLLGNVVIEVRLADANILWRSAATSGANPVVLNANPSFTINASTTYMSITRIAFGDSVYYDLLRNIVSTNGLLIPYKNYTSHRGAQFTKAAGTFNHQFSVNASHLTKLIGTLIVSDYQTDAGLLNTDTVGWKEQVSLDAVDKFNQCRYFKKDGTGLGTVQWDINNVSQYPAPISPADIVCHNAIALNMDNDIQSGVHQGMATLYDFLRHYFLNILSFEHIQNTTEFVLEGLDGKSAPINCVWKLNFDQVGVAGDLIPLVWSENQRILQINAGQQLLVI